MVMSSRPLRVGVAGAKAQLAAIVRAAPTRRTIIQRRGKDAAVVIGIEELHRLEARSEGETDGARVLTRLAAWRDRTSGVEGFEPEPAAIVAADPFSPGRGKKR